MFETFNIQSFYIKSQTKFIIICNMERLHVGEAFDYLLKLLHKRGYMEL